MKTPYHFCYVYVLRSLKFTNQVYIGFTTDLRKRLVQHNEGKNVSTKRYIPWKLVYYEAFSEKASALDREESLKHNGNPMRELKKRIGFFEHSKSGKGFTLIEMLVYLSLYSILMSGAVVSAYSIFSSSAHNQSRAMVQEEGSFLIGKVDWAMSNAKIIQLPASTGDTLTLKRQDNSSVSISLDGSDLQISENGGAPVTLNNSNVKITSLVFTHVHATGDGINPESIKAELVIDSTASDGISFSRSFSTLKYLRK